MLSCTYVFVWTKLREGGNGRGPSFLSWPVPASNTRFEKWFEIRREIVSEGPKTEVPTAPIRKGRASQEPRRFRWSCPSYSGPRRSAAICPTLRVSPAHRKSARGAVCCQALRRGEDAKDKGVLRRIAHDSHTTLHPLCAKSDTPGCNAPVPTFLGLPCPTTRPCA